MPRAFLIKRYNSAVVDYEENQPSRESSPERRVSTADGACCDSEGDSVGFEGDLKPTSPHSPAHEARSTQHTPTDHVLGLTVFRPVDPSSPTSPFRGAYHPTASALVTVIRQLMQPQGHRSPSANRSPDSSVAMTAVSEPHACAECGKRYSTSSNLARHRQTHRSVTDQKARKCPHCDKVYVSMPAFSMHVRTHSQGCVCPFCGKSFSRPWLLQGHIRTHTGEKPFACPVCRKAFADKSNLRAHIQTHSASKPFVCGRCGKAFALKSYLYKHEESSCMKLHRQQQDSALDLATKDSSNSSSSSEASLYPVLVG